MPDDVKWIHITTGMFNDEKILLIESMPDADSLLVIWVKLICLAGKVNEDGWIYLSKEIPYTIEELATVLHRPVNTVRLAVEIFIRLKMVECNDEGLYLINFTKNQNIPGLERIREQTRKRVADHRAREKYKQLRETNKDVTLHDVTSNAQKRKEKNNIREDEESFIKWNNVLDILKSNVTPSNYRVWLQDTIGVDITDNEFLIGVENNFKAEYLEKNMRGLIEKCISQECQKELMPRFVLWG